MREAFVGQLGRLEILHPLVHVVPATTPAQRELRQRLRQDVALQLLVDLRALRRVGCPQPALNGEPYYSGYVDARGLGGGRGYQYGATGGTEKDDQFVRSSMYGSFLSGGLGGHVYGAEGIWGADIEPAAPIKMWDAFQWNSGKQMQHLRTFAMSIGKRYQEPKLVLFSGAFPTACGTGQAAMGPFYCPLDQKIYIDLAFYEQLKRQFQAPGDFAQAYVIAHEVGHHVQNLMGIMDKVDQMRSSGTQAQANALSVRVELQADCFAGVWAKNADKARSILESGDVEAALNAATAIGDDALQKQSQGYVVPDSFTHGSSAQRVRWFKRGYQTGNLNQCDTFNADEL